MANQQKSNENTSTTTVRFDSSGIAVQETCFFSSERDSFIYETIFITILFCTG